MGIPDGYFPERREDDDDKWTAEKSVANFIACNTGGPSRDMFSADIYQSTTTNYTVDLAREIQNYKQEN